MEGTETGSFNEMAVLNGIPLTQEQQLAAIKAYGGLEVWGTGKIEPHYAAGWAWAGNTPFQWGKQVASHLGGTRNPLVLSWPKGISDNGGLRSQFLHVTDVVPTLLEAAGVPAPRMVDGTAQLPMHGVSFLQTLTDAAAPSRHMQQYFEVLGNRAMYKDGWWLACRLPRIPWKLDPASLAHFAPGRWDPDTDRCELYDLTRDFSQAHDLAAEHPEKVAELRALFWEEAARYQVLPLLGGMALAFGPEYEKPQPKAARYSYQPDVENLSPGVIPPIYNRSFSIEANIEIERNECLLVVCTGAEGVLVAMGDYLGGFSLYVMHGKPRFTYSFLGLKIDTIEGADALPTGSVRVAYEFVADNPGQKATGGLGRLLVNGREVAKGRIEHTVPGQFSSYAGMESAATTACRSFPSSSTPSRSPSRHRRRSRLSISTSSERMNRDAKKRFVGPHGLRHDVDPAIHFKTLRAPTLAGYSNAVRRSSEFIRLRQVGRRSAARWAFGPRPL